MSSLIRTRVICRHRPAKLGDHWACPDVVRGDKTDQLVLDAWIDQLLLHSWIDIRSATASFEDRLATSSFLDWSATASFEDWLAIYSFGDRSTSSFVDCRATSSFGDRSASPLLMDHRIVVQLVQDNEVLVDSSGARGAPPLSLPVQHQVPYKDSVLSGRQLTDAHASRVARPDEELFL